MKKILHRQNYMMGSASEGHCNPYANVDRDAALPKHARRLRSSAGAARSAWSSAHKTGSRPLSKLQIQMEARKVLEGEWRHRKAELTAKGSLDPFEVIDPFRVLVRMGFAVEHWDSLGQFVDPDGTFEVAGEIDPSTRSVRVSRQLRPDVMRFTAAHELGHALLHRGMSLHRDRPVDGAADGRRKDPKEIEADHFAACFLMPETMMRKEFEARFLTDKFALDPDVAFALGASDLETARRMYPTHEELVRMLAGTRFFNGKHFLSLAQQFRVSLGAMAIRLTELGLVSSGATR